jgi:tRNA G26 N,N-dimethylase Trm1
MPRFWSITLMICRSPTLSSVTCFSNYGAYPVHRPYCHELALRILLACIEAHAARCVYVCACVHIFACRVAPHLANNLPVFQSDLLSQQVVDAGYCNMLYYCESYVWPEQCCHTCTGSLLSCALKAPLKG